LDFLVPFLWVSGGPEVFRLLATNLLGAMMGFLDVVNVLTGILDANTEGRVRIMVVFEDRKNRKGINS
jgi:hypothetical protein